MYVYTSLFKKVCSWCARGMLIKKSRGGIFHISSGTPATKPKSNQTKTAKPYFKKCIKTLNIFLETFFSPDSFGFSSSFFLSCCVFSTIRIFLNNKPHFSSAYDITSKQVLVPKRGKKKY
jgi:hypothetical protein